MGKGSDQNDPLILDEIIKLGDGGHILHKTLPYSQTNEYRTTRVISSVIRGFNNHNYSIKVTCQMWTKAGDGCSSPSSFLFFCFFCFFFSSFFDFYFVLSLKLHCSLPNSPSPVF